MTPPRSEQLIEDVSRASAALVWNILSELAKLPATEGFERLADYFRTALRAYFDGLEGWRTEEESVIPEPSLN
jgi:hypothetical protein